MRNFHNEVVALQKVIGKRLAYEGSELDPLGRFLVQTSLRHFFWLDAIAQQLIKKPLPKKHLDLHLLVVLGIAACEFLNQPAHTSVNAAVNSTQGLRKTWAKGLINGALRHFLRHRDELIRKIQDPKALTNHPEWMIERIRAGWGQSAEAVFNANNVAAPMTLRVNRQKVARHHYQRSLTDHGIESELCPLSEDGLVLAQPMNVSDLPGFDIGLASVQDTGAQLAAILLNPKPHDRVLDACTAPGGKACHLLEIEPTIDLVAVDNDPLRLMRAKENLTRLGQSDVTQCLDLTQPQPGLGSFDQILLDAPCSASGVIRRHPDIKLLRRESDLQTLRATQDRLLQACWQLLRPGGHLLYVTCSVFLEENTDAIAEFLRHQSEAVLKPLPTIGVPCTFGVQLLPTVGAHDGFYFARIRKMGHGI